MEHAKPCNIELKDEATNKLQSNWKIRDNGKSRDDIFTATTSVVDCLHGIKRFDAVQSKAI